MKTYKEQVQDKIRTIVLSNKKIRIEHVIVLNMIVRNNGTAITQDYIYTCDNTLGEHKRHCSKTNKRDNALRHIRHLIRELRVKFNLPILSSKQGYYLPNNTKEANEFIQRFNTSINNQIKSMNSTRYILKHILKYD